MPRPAPRPAVDVAAAPLPRELPVARRDDSGVEEKGSGPPIAGGAAALGAPAAAVGGEEEAGDVPGLSAPCSAHGGRCSGRWRVEAAADPRADVVCTDRRRAVDDTSSGVEPNGRLDTSKLSLVGGRAPPNAPGPRTGLRGGVATGKPAPVFTGSLCAVSLCLSWCRWCR